MCEVEAAFSIAFVDWSSDVDKMRLGRRDEDYRQYSRWIRDRRSVPSKADEAEASAILQDVDNVIKAQFGLEGTVTRYILCSSALETRKPIVALARALVSKIRQHPS